jgi:protein-S-isoprenylcysteine O-methyltransferase Ste14
MLIAFVWPTYWTYKRTGINPLTFGNSDNAHDFVGKWFKIIIMFIPVNIIIFWLGKDWYSFTLPALYFDNHWSRVIGVTLCIISLTWTSIAQYQMGVSWRIGIDEKNKTPLVRKGLFSISRNPIFLGMFLTLSGVFFCLPNALSLLTLTCGFLLMQVQIRLEEEFLFKQYGVEYLNYRRQTRRWL